MGSEYGQFLEWKSEEQLEWSNLEDPMNAKMKYFTSQLNQFYKDHRCLWEIDTSYDGIEIIDADNRDQSVLSFIRKGKKGEMLVCIFNMVPVERKDFTIGLPVAGIYEEVWNTELEEWGGVWKEHNQTVQTQEGLWKDYEQTLTFTLPAMGASVWKIKRRLKSTKTVTNKNQKGVENENEMLALILAGGQGTRLGKLTQSIAKPAVQFGGRYRIIDFALSNCANSGIHNVGVVTQYQPLALNNHIGNGSSWGLDGINSGVSILQPYSASEGNRWFEGTSHAIYQNIDYIDSVNPEYVLILSGDHIYKMDYDDMLQSHKDNNASLTVAVLDVPLKEASRFGIMNTDANNRIVEFEEKPAQL